MSPVPFVKTNSCTTCDVCAEICPDVFQINDDLVAEVVDPFGDTEEAIQEAIDLCPESCIVWK